MEILTKRTEDKKHLLNHIETIVKMKEDGVLNHFIKNSKNLDYIRYTMLHRKCIEDLAKNLMEEKHKDLYDELKAHEEFKYHDVDKIILYLFHDKATAHNTHVETCMHHSKNDLSPIILLIKLFDYESAPYTKPDKTLNAYDTILTYYPEAMPYMLPYLELLGLNHPSSGKCISIEDYNELEKNIIVSDIETQINNYIDYLLN